MSTGSSYRYIQPLVSSYKFSASQVMALKQTATSVQRAHRAVTKHIIDASRAAALQGRCDKVVNYSVGNRITDVNRRLQEVNPLSLLGSNKEWRSPQKRSRTSCPVLSAPARNIHNLHLL